MDMLKNFLRVHLTGIVIVLILLTSHGVGGQEPVQLNSRRTVIINITSNPAIDELIRDFVQGSRDSTGLDIVTSGDDRNVDNCGDATVYVVTYSRDLDKTSNILAYVKNRGFVCDRDTIFINPYVPSIQDFEVMKHEFAHLLGYDHVNTRGHWMSTELKRTKRSKYVCARDVDTFHRFKNLKKDGTPRKNN